MKKLILTLCCFALAAGLLLALPAALNAPEEESAPFVILRVWNAEEEPAVQSWLRRQVKQYERETGLRVYLRAADAGEAAAKAAQGLAPDALILPEGDTLLALRGYALILRDDTAAAVTPAPTGALFFRPSSPPEPAASPAPWPEEAVGAVLCPEALMNALPGTVRSLQPAAELAQGKARAALLTPGQAAGLSFGYRACALPEGKGMVPVNAAARTEAGEALLAWLQGEGPQRALAAAGLFSPRFRLYGPDDPVRYLIESAFFAAR